MVALGFLGVYTLGILMAFKRPIFGLYTYILAFYLNPMGYWWGGSLPSLRWSFIAAIVTIIAIMANPPKKHKVKISSFNLPLTLLVVWIVFQNIWALSYSIHSEFTVVCIKFIIAYWIMVKTIQNEKDLLGFIIINVIGAGYLGWYAHGLNRGGRLEGVGPPGLHDANFLGLHAAAVLIFASFLLLSNLGRKKFLLVPFIILTLLLIILTQSRGAMAGMLVAGAYVIITIPKQFRKQLFFYGALGVAAMAIAMDQSFWDRLTGTAKADNAEELDKSAYSRIVVAEAQLKMFVTNPIVGYGHRGTMLLSPDYIDETYMTGSSENRMRASHNTYLSVAVEQGFIGVILYWWLIWRTLSISRRTTRKAIAYDSNSLIAGLCVGTTAAFISVLVSNLFIDGLRLEILIWLIALIDIYGSFLERMISESSNNES